MDRLAAAVKALVAAVALALAAAAPAEAAWPGANGRISWVTVRDGKQQTRVGPLDLRPSRRIAWYRPLPAGLHRASGYAQWDPSGARMIFQHVSKGFEIRTARGRLVRRFGVNELYWPSWSPDGRLIVAGDLSAHPVRRLAILRPDGEVVRRIELAATRNAVVSPRWSPSGRWIVYEEPTPRGPRVRRVAVSGAGGDRRLAVGALPTWSPDGSRIAFASGPDVFTMLPDGSARRRVARSRQRDAGIAGLAWSPRGDRIAFVRQDSVDAHHSSTVVTVPATGGRERVERRTERFVASIDWQPR
ncbi:MAG: hypothetical protein ABWZ67_00655 [Solirubrobacteraceae bacterium]